MSELDVRGVVVNYHDRVALAGVDFSVASGEVVTVLGSSGCGKSTLLRAIAGLVPLASGSVTLDGRDLAGVPTHRRGIGLMFQDHALFAHMDVRTNVRFGLRMAGWDRVRSDDRVRTMLELVGLADRGGAGIHELSGGEQQRVALARTLAPEPRVVLLDEPLGSLDRVLRRDLIPMLRAAFDRTGATAVHVTHDRDEAFKLGDRVALMRSGRIEQIAVPDVLIAKPASDWVRSFLSD